MIIVTLSWSNSNHLFVCGLMENEAGIKVILAYINDKMTRI